MQKVLMIDAEKCTGCRACEIACSFHHERECDPARSRIHIIKWEEAGIDVPMVCQQCEVPVCEKVCPVGAIARNQKTGAVLINHDVCIGCRICVIACPFGGVAPDTERKVIKCDLCDGDPACVKFCSTEAIKYISPTKAVLLKKRFAAERLGELIKIISKLE